MAHKIENKMTQAHILKIKWSDETIVDVGSSIPKLKGCVYCFV